MKLLQKRNTYVTILLKIGKEIYKMKEASGELNMTLVTIIAIAAIAGLFFAFRNTIMGAINSRWNEVNVSDPAKKK